MSSQQIADRLRISKSTLLTGVFTQQFISHLVVSGDAAATAADILSHESVFRLGFAVYLVELACQITMTTLMYGLLKPVSRSGSLLAAIFGLIGNSRCLLSDSKQPGVRQSVLSTSNRRIDPP